MPTRTPLPTCQYHVGPNDNMCGLPAVAIWNWDDSDDNRIFACEKHDELIATETECDAD